MTTANNWKVDADGDWSTAANWSLGHTPTSANTVTISTATVHTVTHNSGSDVISKLTVGNDFFNLSGGSLNILTTASFSDGYTQTGGVLTVGAIAITGPANLLSGTSEGSTTFTVTGATTLSGYTFGGASVLNVSTTANETGQVALGDTTGVGAAINVASGGVYNIAGDFGITGGASSATFTNGGTLKKLSGAGTSVVGASVNSTGTIASASGELQFDGPTNAITGTLSGAGQISFGSGVTTLGAVTASVATLGIYGTATVNLTADLTYAHTLIDSSHWTTSIGLGTHTLTLQGPSATIAGAFGTANVTGSGTLSNQSVLTLSNAVLGGTVKLSNGGTIDQVGQLTVGDGGGLAPSIVNLSTGVYDFTNDTGIAPSNAASTFVNQGLIVKNGGVAGQASAISMAVTNAGTIRAQVGTLAFSNSVVNTGTIGGAGSFELFTTGALTLNAGSVLAVATFDLFDSTSLTLGTSLTYAGVFNNISHGNTQINLAANTLTLSGASNSIVGAFGVADIAGSGTLANTGTLTLGNTVIDGTTQINNTGVINQSANVTIGGGGGQVSSIANAKGAHYNLAGDFVIGNGTATASNFANAGVFTVQAGIGTATLATTFNNAAGAQINVASGLLENDGSLTNAGTISGKQLVLGASGQTTFSGASTLSVGEIDLVSNASLTLTGPLTYAGSFVDASHGNTKIDLKANTLTLTGVTDFDPSFGVDLITGTGTLKLSHATTLEGSTVQIVGTATLSIGAKVTVTGNLQLGDASANAAQAVLTATGTYDLTADAGIQVGASAASTFANNGLFEKTAGTGTSIVSTKFVNNGTITVTSGTIEFLAGTLSGNGIINGLKTTDGSGDVFVSASGPGVVKASALAAPAASPSLLAQALAAFHSDQGLLAHLDLAAENQRQTHANAIGANPIGRRLH